MCKSLAKRDSIRILQRNWYRVIPKGDRESWREKEKEPEKKGLIKKRPRKIDLKIKSPIWRVVKIKESPEPQHSKNIKLKSGFKRSKEEKLKISKKIEKVAFSLGKLRLQQ